MSRQSPWQQFKHRSPESRKKSAIIILMVFLPIMRELQTKLFNQGVDARPKLLALNVEPRGSMTTIGWRVSPAALSYIEIATEAKPLEKSRYDSQQLKQDHDIDVKQLQAGITYIINVHAWYEGSKYAVMPEIGKFTIEYDEKSRFSLNSLMLTEAADRRPH